MELRQLKYFVTVANTLSFSQAAKQLYVTQGTLSQQIAQLEQELDQQLFQRTSRRVVLTVAGEELLPFAKKTIDDAQNCAQRMRDIRTDLCGTLRIGFAYCFSGLMVSTVKEFHKAYPKVTLSLYKRRASELIDMLRADKLDLVLAFTPNEDCDDLCMDRLFASPIRAVLRTDHPLAHKAALSREDLMSHGIALPGISLNARRGFMRFIGMDKGDLDVRMELDDPQMLLDVVRTTSLIGVVAPVGSMDLNDGVPLVLLPIEGLDLSLPCCVHTMQRAITKSACKVFVEVLKDQLRFG